MISNCLEQKPLPIYGRGSNVRDWLYVEDHAEAVWEILKQGKRGEVYNIGGGTELTNLEMLDRLITSLSTLMKVPQDHYRSLIRFVADRPGHDFRYAIDASKIHRELGWKPRWTLDQALKKTVKWYARQRVKA